MFIGKQRTEKKTRDFQTVIKVRALFWFDHFGIFDWTYQFSAGKIQFFRCVSVAYFILMVFRYSFDFGFYIFSVHQFAQLLFSISIWREKFLRFIHLFVDIQLGFLYGILSSLSLDNVQLFENVKYGKEATANFVMWRIRNFNIIIFFFWFSVRFVFHFHFIWLKRRKEKDKDKDKKKHVLNSVHKKECVWDVFFGSFVVVEFDYQRIDIVFGHQSVSGNVVKIKYNIQMCDWYWKTVFLEISHRWS